MSKICVMRRDSTNHIEYKQWLTQGKPIHAPPSKEKLTKKKTVKEHLIYLKFILLTEGYTILYSHAITDI